MILIELGRRLSSNGLMATAALAAGPLLGAEPKRRARNGCAACPMATSVRRQLSASPDRISYGPSATVTVGLISGAASCVADVAGAEVVILPAIDIAERSCCSQLPRQLPALVWTNAPMLDITRRFADLQAEWARG